MIEPRKIIDALIAYGALEIDAIDSGSGEIVFKVTDKLKEVFPVLYEEISETVYQDILSLWEIGLVEMNILDSEPTVEPTEKGLDRNNWNNLSDTQINVMNTIMRRFEGSI